MQTLFVFIGTANQKGSDPLKCLKLTFVRFGAGDLTDFKGEVAG
jgi:hypothetical protein